MVTQASGASRWLTLNGEPLRFGPDADNVEAEAKEYSDNRFEWQSGAPRDLAIRVEDEYLDTRIPGLWSWRPAGFAGLYKVMVTGGGVTHRTYVRVLPGNLSQERYEHMLRQIGQFSADLLF